MDNSLDRQVAESEQRAFRYWYQDGLAEGTLGVLFVLLGVYFGLEARLPASSTWRGLSALVLPGLVIGGIYALRWAVRRLKEQITYPRTGYVAFRRDEARGRWGRRWWWRVGIAAAMGALVGALFAMHPLSLAWIPAVQGVIVGLFFYFMASRTNLPRFYLYALASVFLGISATWVAREPAWGNAFYYVAMGTLLVAAGGWVLSRYLRHTHTATER